METKEGSGWFHAYATQVQDRQGPHVSALSSNMFILYESVVILELRRRSCSRALFLRVVRSLSQRWKMAVYQHI